MPSERSSKARRTTTVTATEASSETTGKADTPENSLGRGSSRPSTVTPVVEHDGDTAGRDVSTSPEDAPTTTVSAEDATMTSNPSANIIRILAEEEKEGLAPPRRSSSRKRALRHSNFCGMDDGVGVRYKVGRSGGAYYGKGAMKRAPKSAK